MKGSPSSAHSGSIRREIIQDTFSSHGSINDDPLGTLKSSEPAPERESNNKKKGRIEDEVYMKYKSLKQFDTVLDYSDHHFGREGFHNSGPTLKGVAKNWAKRIQYEWKILEKDLPETIYVRAHEDRMDLLRAVIIGAAGTPYHDGIFFFDIHFPPHYPNEPPLVHYHAGGLSINPNLYDCGKVCLSLLNTWGGNEPSEMWMPSTSTMLQVLVSIQGLILNAKPYFNEPGSEILASHRSMETRSLAFNENVFLLSCKTMLYSLRRPPKHFEDFVSGHFRTHGPAILAACFAYMNGAQVGCADGDGVGGACRSNGSCTPGFESSLSELFEALLKEFTIRGAVCDEIAAQRAKHAATNGAPRRARGVEPNTTALFPQLFPHDIHDSTPLKSPLQLLISKTTLTSPLPLPLPRPLPLPLPHGFSHIIHRPATFAAAPPWPYAGPLIHHQATFPAAPLWPSASPLRLLPAFLLPPPFSGHPLFWQPHYSAPFYGISFVGSEQWIPPPPPPLFSTIIQQRPPTQPHAHFLYPPTTANTFNGWQ